MQNKGKSHTKTHIMNVSITLTEADLKKLVLAELSERLRVSVGEADVRIETKSKQNFKSEWEIAAFRATINVDTVTQ